MKGFFATLFLTFTFFVSFAQLPVPVDSLYTFIKFNSIHRNKANWNTIDKTFKEQIQEAKSNTDTMNCFVKVLESLNDVHSQIYLNNQFYGHYPSFDDSVLVWLKPLNEKAIALTNKFHATRIQKKIGYICVPSIQVYDPAEINRYAQTLSDLVSNLANTCKKGFIIDLRLNGGGNLYPMLSGLGQFLGNQIIGYETDNNDSITRTWELKNGNFVIGGYQTTTLTTKPNSKLKTIPIVVLIGPVTKSSGSMTAIAFKGRPNTYFIGEPTADGYTTSNGYFQFAPNLVLNFATNFVADRTKKVYKTTVNPDLTIYHGNDFDTLLNDAKIKAAIKWLTKK